MANRHIIPIFIPFSGCPIQCIYCDQNQITGVGSGITGEEVSQKIYDALEKIGDAAPEVAFYGGTFGMLPQERQAALLQSVAPFIAAGRIASIRISTRPEGLEKADFLRFWEMGIRVIEFGIQSIDPLVLQRTKRGITLEEMDRVTTLARSFGFSIGLQQMTGLPHSSREKDIQTAEWIAKRADFVRIYPTVVFEHTALYEMYLRGTYQPQSLEDAVVLAAQLLDLYESKGVDVVRVGLDYMKREAYIAGPYDDNFREYAESYRFVEKILNHYDTVKYISGSAKAINRIVGPRGYGRKRLEVRYGPISFKITSEEEIRIDG